MEFYETDDEDEIGKAEVDGPDGTARVVVRAYDLPDDFLESDLGSTIKFVWLEPWVDDEFDIAIYIPAELIYLLPDDLLRESLSTLMTLAGMAFHAQGRDAFPAL